MRRLPFLALLTALFPSAAFAEGPSADLRGTAAPLHHEAGLGLEPVRSDATGDMTASFRVSYAFRPVVLRDATGDIRYSVVEHQFTGDVMLALGLFERLTIGIDLPILLGQVGDEVRFDPAAERLVGSGRVPVAGLGDAGLRLKGTIVKPELDALGLPVGFGLGADERFTLPSGDERSFLGEGSVTSETRLLAEYTAGPLTSHLRAGIKLRAEPGAYACDPDLPEGTCLSRFGHEVPLGVGFAFHPRALGIDPDGIATLFVEGRGYLPVAPVAITDSTLPAGFFASVAGRLAFGDLALLGGVEIGLNDGVGVAPIRATFGLSMAPRSKDSDGDGLVDDVDRCPQHAEDFDGFEDQDGCPEMDNDVDGVPDVLDKCPMQPGTRGDDGDGCPAI